MRVKFNFLLIILLFILCSTVVFAEWLHYGNSQGSEHTFLNVGGTTNLTLLNSYPTGINEFTEPLIINYGPGNNESIVTISAGGTISIINLKLHTVIKQYATGLVPHGQMDYQLNTDRFFGVFTNGSDTIFAKMQISESIFDVTSSIRVGNSSEFINSGTKCTDGGSSSCVFANFDRFNSKIYEIDATNFNVLGNITPSNIASLTPPMNNVPAIADTGVNIVAYFSILKAITGGPAIIAYSLTSHSILTAFGVNGIKGLSIDNYYPTSNPSVINVNGINNLAITYFDGTMYNCLKIMDLGGSDITTTCGSTWSCSGNCQRLNSQPFFAECKLSGWSLPRTGIGAFITHRNVALNTWDGLFIFYDSLGVTSTTVIKRNIQSGGNYPFETGQIISTADFEGDGTTELIASIRNADNTINTLTYTCNFDRNGNNFNEIQNLSINSNFYGPVITNFVGTSQLTTILTRLGSTFEFANYGINGTAASCGNFLCEFGENHVNCPSDCAATCGNLICEPPGETTSTCPLDCGTAANGSTTNINIPSQLVDINSANPLDPTVTGGLLPETYMGVRSFFSHTFANMFIILLFIMVVMLVFTIGRLFVKKL